MGKMKCELCDGVARMHCESDQASLCWDCDGKVHGANFLVAKHTRSLLCSACQSPTPWKASGLRLGPTVSICESCLARKNNSVAVRNLNLINCRDFDGDRLKPEHDGAESYYDDENVDEEEEKVVENHVVPWDAAAAQQPPVVTSSSLVSSSEEDFSCDGGLVAKRTIRHSDLKCSDEESSRPKKMTKLRQDQRLR